MVPNRTPRGYYLNMRIIAAFASSLAWFEFDSTVELLEEMHN
jgi:hypothetical protein